MRKHKAVLISLLAAGCAAGITPAAAEEYRGSYAQQLACTPDVFRLCGSEIPDVNRIVACLRQNQQQLGAPCKAVFESNAEATPSDVAPKPTPGQIDVAPPPERGPVRPVR